MLAVQQDLSLKKYPQKKVVQIKNQTHHCCNQCSIQDGHQNNLFSRRLLSTFYMFDLCSFVYFLVSCQPAFKFEYFSTIRTLELWFGKWAFMSAYVLDMFIVCVTFSPTIQMILFVVMSILFCCNWLRFFTSSSMSDYLDPIFKLFFATNTFILILFIHI